VDYTAEERLQVARLGDGRVDRVVRRMPANFDQLREAIDVP
jgi:hypothetical protein